MTPTPAERDFAVAWDEHRDATIRRTGRDPGPPATTAAEIAAGLTPAQRRFPIGKKHRHNDCTTNLKATMGALEKRGLGRRQRMGFGSGRPDYTWHPSPLGCVVAACIEEIS